MIKNIFIEQPEFIDNDPRVHRPKISGTAITSGLMGMKQAILLPPQLLHGKRVLDLGSCNAASGAWALSHGAIFYKGIELQEEFAKNSEQALAKYYPKEQWCILKESIEVFLDSNEEEFDLIIASGIFHSFSNPLEMMKKMMKIGKSIVIESSHPTLFEKTKFMNSTLKKLILNAKDYSNFIENEPFMQLGIEGMTVPGEQTLLFEGIRPSMGAFIQSMRKEGFIYVDEINQKLKQHMPKIYSPYGRFGMLFLKKRSISPEEYGFLSASSGKSANKLYKWA